MSVVWSLLRYDMKEHWKGGVRFGLVMPESQRSDMKAAGTVAPIQSLPSAPSGSGADPFSALTLPRADPRVSCRSVKQLSEM